MDEKLRRKFFDCSNRLIIMHLHSTVPLEEQRRVFNIPRPGFRKVILSTNIAESSITVTDIKYGKADTQSLTDNWLSWHIALASNAYSDRLLSDETAASRPLGLLGSATHMGVKVELCTARRSGWARYRRPMLSNRHQTLLRHENWQTPYARDRSKYFLC